MFLPTLSNRTGLPRSGLHIPAGLFAFLMSSLITAQASQPVSSPSSEPDSVQLHTVVVTGEKLGRSLADTSTSVSVYDASNVEDQGDKSFHDLLRRAANTAADEEGRFSIRGISQVGAAGGDDAPVISVQVDGVTLDETAQNGAVLDLFDVEQVEILRGAQSTSQGRNALAGAVIVNTRDPTREWEARLRSLLAERGGRELAAAGGGPISESFAFRLLGSQKQDNGFITHVPDGNRNFAFEQTELLRGKLAWTPVFWPGFKSVLMLGTDESDGQPDYNIERGEAGSDPSQRRTSAASIASRDLVNSEIASLRNTLVLSPQYSLTAVTAAMKTHNDYLRDYDGMQEDNGRNDVFNDGENLSQELRLNLQQVNGWINGTVGLYAGRFQDSFISVSENVRSNLQESGTTPVGGDAVELMLGFEQVSLRDARNAALFSEFDLLLSSRLTATVGLRHDRESLIAADRFSTNRADASLVLPDALAPLGALPLGGLPSLNALPLLAAGGVTPNTGGLQGGKTDYSATLPKLGLRYVVLPTWSVFATYAEAYRAGGVDVDTRDGTVYPYDPEFTKNYEIGVRGAWEPHNLDVAANLFYTDWRDQQVPVLRGFFFVTQNAGKSRLQGGELTLGWQPMKQLRVQAAFGLVETEFLDYHDANNDYSGKQFIFAPRSTGSIGAIWRNADGWMASGNWSTRGHSFSTPANTPDDRSDARQLLDLKLGYEGARFSAYLFGRNVLDEDYVTATYQFRNGYIGGSSPRGYASYGEPQTFGAQLELQL